MSSNKTNKSGQARAINELLCKILEENNISFVRAETLRQAKFNKCSATKSMGQLLFDVVCLCDSDNKNQDEELLKQMIPSEKQMAFLKTELQGLGYLSHSFASIPNDFSTGSRELLLALGWVIHQQNFMDKVIKGRSNPLHQDFKNLSKLDSDLRSSEEFSTNSNHDNQLCLKERIQYHMMLIGKLRMSLRRLHSSYQQLASLTNMIHQSTEGVNLQPGLSYLTPLEVHALRFPGTLKKILQELERDNLELTHLLEWKQKESVFWEWMGSVLTAHIESESRVSSAASSYVDTLPEPTIYLPVPADIGQQIESARDSLRDVILRHEGEMSKVEEIIQRKKISTVEAEVHKMHMDKELFEKTLQLRTCGLGEERDVQESCGADETMEATLGVNGKVSSRYMVSHNEVLSPYAAKAARRETLLKKVNDEISKLKEKVEKLQTELRHMQLQNMQEVQRVIDKEKSVICVQPRSLKDYYD